MESFDFDFHTKMIFGAGAENRVGATLKEAEIQRVLVHYDDAAIKTGLLERVQKNIEDAKISVFTLGGVRPNPDIGLVYEGIETCKAESIQCVVAIGGGSAIDSSKAMVVGVGNPDIDVWDCYSGLVPAPNKALMLAAVPTTAATGSESNASSVLSNGTAKRSFFCDASRPAYAFMNPELLYTLPEFQRRCTVADIFVHTHERYCAHHGENKIADACSEGNMRVMLEWGPTFVEEPSTYQASSEVMFAGSFAYMVAGLGGPPDWSTHNMAHEISGHFPEYTHATTITAMWASWASYVVGYNTPRFAQFARNVFGIDSPDELDAAKQAIARTKQFFHETLRLPISIPELMGRSLSPEEIDALADSCTLQGRRPTIGKLKELDRRDLINIYNSANTPETA